MLVDWICRLLVCDAKEVPGPVCGLDEGVVVEIPGLRFANGWVVDFYEGAAGYFVWELAAWYALARPKARTSYG
jgi:hypothetical protein